ncbi:hypothetical protein BBO_01181 [Beauveria brongniartii RCEF 3172]|uniref:Uncharacterized protein n=1 Tax=Beauveria brongniartii RCEF 3172 TaxID=1081107 RepID=A0A167K5A4_9HYPO|nr:hypothetical protein BBO_01181 [Beauveria brongniartii RCEF 3172]
MKISASVSVLVYATCASAFVTIPDTLPDGIYQVEKQTDPQQDPKIRRMDIAPPVVAKRGRCSGGSCDDAVLVPRDDKYPSRTFLTEKLPFPGFRPFCRNETHTLTVDNLHAAVNRLFYTPLYWIPPNSARFALYNGTVAYICNLGSWGSGSLVEYMEAMRILDERCVAADGWDNSSVVVRAAKLSVRKYEKFYGREVAGVPICQWETEKGGIRNDLLEKEEEGCLSYVNGMRRFLGGGETWCNDDATGYWLWVKLRAMFPWYNSRDAATND